VGRVLYHLIRSDRVDAFVYIWWNEDPFTSIQDELPDEAEYKKILLLEGRRVLIPFARHLGVFNSWIDGPRIQKTVAACRELTDEPYWIWATDPRLSVSAYELANRLNGKLCVDIVDNFEVRYEGRQRELFRKAYEDTVRFADKIVANNPEMQSYLNIPDTQFRCVLNGVDWQVFHNGINLPEPPEMVSIPHPRVGFVGTLSSLNDVSFLNAVAREIPECEVIVVGPTKNANKPLHPRIHTLGMKPYNEVPSYLSSFDICLSIYDEQHPSTQYGDSQKIKEYLAAGKPIVSSYSSNNRTESTHVCVAKNVDEFVCMVRDTIRKSVNADLREKISLSVADQDWRLRIAEIIDFLKDDKV
jgi:glycosyltransferase involved in cell wall biosynthesis